MKRLPLILCAMWLLRTATPVPAALTASLAPSVVNGARGSELLFSGTLANTDPTDSLFLNDLRATLTGSASNFVSLSSNAFFANVPGILLPGETYTGVVFRVVLNDVAPAGDYSGTITLQGGTNIFATNDLVGADFLVLSADVSLAASDPSASEFGPDPGAFTVSRTGGTNIDLTVLYTVSGTATNGVTYTTIPSSITIPAGAASATISITPIPDSIAQGDRSVSLNVAASANYNLGSGTNATVTIHDKPIDQWRLQKFGALANSPAAADTADWDSDGLANLLEYALNLEPTNANSAPLLVPVIVGDYLRETYLPNPAAIDATLGVEASTNLVNWSAADVETVSIPDPDPPGSITVRYNHPVSLTGAVVLRLRATRLGGP